jgi:hypothetical protein
VKLHELKCYWIAVDYDVGGEVQALAPPVWDCADNKADQDLFIAWTKAHLFRRAQVRHAAAIRWFKSMGDEFDPVTWLVVTGKQTLKALRWDVEAGVPEAVKKLHPELANYNIQPRGKPGPPQQRNWLVEFAAADVYFIRRLWKREFDLVNRKHSNADRIGDPDRIKRITSRPTSGGWT